MIYINRALALIAETFKQLLGPQNHRKFNCYYSFIYKTYTNHLKPLKNLCKNLEITYYKHLTYSFFRIFTITIWGIDEWLTLAFCKRYMTHSEISYSLVELIMIPLPFPWSELFIGWVSNTNNSPERNALMANT